MKAWFPILSIFAIALHLPSSSSAAEFRIKAPGNISYVVNEPAAKSKSQNSIIRGHRKGSTNVIEFYSRVFLEVKLKEDLSATVTKSGIPIAKRLNETAVVLEARNPWQALEVCAELSLLPSVKAAHPVTRTRMVLFSAYAPAPKDPYFRYQWYLEQRNANGSATGADINVRSAWAVSKGEGVIVGIADDGIEVTHPDLITACTGNPHFNFANDTVDASPTSSSDGHGTAVAGLVAAEADNNIGISGVAPRAKISNLKVFDRGEFVMSDEDLSDLYQFHSDIVGVQNHSWGEGDVVFHPLSGLEQLGLFNAVTYGRDGKGVVIVRAAGNNRANGGNANFDGNPSSPYVIAVGAVKINGEFAGYSSPGACILVGAPGGDYSTGTIFTTDRQGTNGFNFANYANDFANYAFDGSGFVGTSASSPIVAGIAALVLSANTNLTYRDVQQILLLSARPLDLTDSDIVTNAAGLKVSHNVGFGIPDAGVAVRLAQRWQTRPAATNVLISTNISTPIPDDGLRVAVVGGGSVIKEFGAIPSLGVPIDQNSTVVPLVDIGKAQSVPASMKGKAALIQGGINTFRDKIDNATKAGAVFAVVYNQVGGTVRLVMGDTEHTSIPAVYLNQQDGEALQQYLATNGTANVQLQLNSASTTIQVTNTLVVEHVSVRIQSDHTNNSQLRITLTSPQGTRSVLQGLNFTTNALTDWTYYSTHHFYESSAGSWTVAVTDQEPGSTGTVSNVELTIEGVPIQDADGNGLDDNWELAQFGSLGNSPSADPDLDGYSNAIEQVLLTDPGHFDLPFKLDYSKWNTNYARISFPSSTNFNYEIKSGATINGLTVATNLAGRFPESEFFAPLTNGTRQFFQVHSTPKP